jgi:hypothetical protein
MSATQSPAFIIVATVRRRKTFGPQDDFGLLGAELRI